MSVYKGNKQPSLHGTVDDFFRRPHAGPLAQDLAAAHTTRGKNAHFSRNCYNTAALRDRIPSCIRLWKAQRSVYKGNKNPSLHGTVDDFFCRPNAGPLAQDLAAAHTTRGKNAHFSRNCYNTAALRERIPSCVRLWKRTDELSQRKTKSLLLYTPHAEKNFSRNCYNT